MLISYDIWMVSPRGLRGSRCRNSALTLLNSLRWALTSAWHISYQRGKLRQHAHCKDSCMLPDILPATPASPFWANGTTLSSNFVAAGTAHCSSLEHAMADTDAQDTGEIMGGPMVWVHGWEGSAWDDAEVSALVKDALWQLADARADAVAARAAVATLEGTLGKRLASIEQVERTHSMQIHAHVENFAQEIQDCELMLVADGLADRAGPRDGPMSRLSPALNALIKQVEDHSQHIETLADQCRKFGTTVAKDEDAAWACALLEGRALEREAAILEIRERLRMDSGAAADDDLLCQLAKDVFVKIPEALAGHEALLMEATSRVADLGGAFRPLAAADLIGRMTACELLARQAETVSSQPPSGFQDIVDQGAIKLTRRLKEVESGMAEAARRLGTANVVKLGDIVSEMYGSLAGLSGLAARVSAAEARADDLAKEVAAIAAQMDKVAAMEALARVFPGLIADGFSQCFRLAAPDLIAAIVDATLEALPRRNAPPVPGPPDDVGDEDGGEHPQDHDSRSSISPGSPGVGAGDDNEEEDGIVWTENVRTRRV